MKQGQPSKTAEWVARQRAAHLVFTHPPHVLEDPLALRILSEEQRTELSQEGEAPADPGIRLARDFLVARSRYAEDTLAKAVAAGVGQYVVLGAGLDTFAYRNPFPSLRVFEVDHPSTQAWKRERLAAGAIPVPSNVTFTPVDFESQSLAQGLAAVGFRRDLPAFFSWLGVTLYLTLESFRSTLAFIAAQPPGSGVALDYGLPRQGLSAAGQKMMDEVTSQVAALGEPLRLSFSPEQLTAELTRMGFSQVENLDEAALHARYFAQRTGGPGEQYTLARLASAWIRGS